MRKRVLLVTFHVWDSVRRGGFHFLGEFFRDTGYDVDMLTIPVSITWLWANSDRENPVNLFRLIMGRETRSGDGAIRNFGIPNLMPHRLHGLVPSVDEARFLVPSWNSIRRKLRDAYDVIIVESTSGVLLYECLRRSYPGSHIIYRPSDPIAAYSRVNLLVEGERNIMHYADQIWPVGEHVIGFYKETYGRTYNTMSVVHNPFITQSELSHMRSLVPKAGVGKVAVYIGAFPVDGVLLLKLAKRFPTVDFVVVGVQSSVNAPNLHFPGYLTKKDYERILEFSDVGIVPYSRRGRINDLLGITGKLSIYMRRLMPVVAINVSDAIRGEGIMVAKSHDEFTDYFQKALAMTVDDRVGLKESYYRVLSEYTEERVSKTLRERLGGFVR